MPGNLARPVWVDDPDFDVAYHVRRSALPKPGSDEQLTELVARLMSRPLDHARPLWEMYLVEGLARGRTAVLTKTHQAMVDGISAIDIGQVILDVSPEPRVAAEELWMPRNEPTDVELICDAVAEAIARPGVVVDNVRAAAGDAVATVGQARGAPAAPAVDGPHGQPRRRPGHPAQRGDLHRSAGSRSPAPSSRTTARSARRTACTVNDVVLSVVAGALRTWLLSRGEPVTSSSSVRAMVPMSVRGQADVPSSTTTGSLGQPGVVVPRGPAGGRAEPGGAAAPGDARDAGAHGERAARRRRHAGADRRLRAAHPARARRPRGQRLLQTDLQPGGDERAGPAVPALRRGRAHAGAVPGGAAGQGTGARASA